MVQSSPRNPNLCAACEQLLADDCAELERLMMAVVAEAPARAPATAPRDFYPSPGNASELQTGVIDSDEQSALAEHLGQTFPELKIAPELRS